VTTRQLWTLTIIGEPETGGTPCMRARVDEMTHDSDIVRGAFEDQCTHRFCQEHPGCHISSMWWASETVEERDQ
jgi:hypothetical protein